MVGKEEETVKEKNEVNLERRITGPYESKSFEECPVK